jgi:hypothetical protein
MTTLQRSLAAAGLVVQLAACSYSSGSPHPGSAQIEGKVRAAPACPVERLGSPCPSRPVPGASVQVLQHTSVVATARTDSAGRYRLNVAPGAYTIVATNVGGYRSTAQRRVSAVGGQQTTVDLVVDTGIR